MKSITDELETKTTRKIKELRSDGKKVSEEIKKGVAHLWANVKNEYKKMSSFLKKTK